MQRLWRDSQAVDQKKVSEDVMLFFASDIVFPRLAPVCDDKNNKNKNNNHYLNNFQKKKLTSTWCIWGGGSHKMEENAQTFSSVGGYQFFVKNCEEKQATAADKCTKQERMDKENLGFSK